MAILSVCSDREALVQAIEENVWSLWSSFGRGANCVFHDVHGARILETPLRHHPYNFVMHFEGSKDPSGEIDAVFERFGRRGAPFIWMITPNSTPGTVARHLEQRGLEIAEVLPGMVARLDSVRKVNRNPPPEIEIREVRPEDADLICEFVSYRWQVPVQFRPKVREFYNHFRVSEPGSPTRMWVAWHDGAAVGKALLHIGAGVAGVHAVATHPEMRGRGIGSLLTQEVLDAGRKAGCEVAVLCSSPMAEPLYASFGFERLADFLVYAPEDEFHA